MNLYCVVWQTTSDTIDHAKSFFMSIVWTNEQRTRQTFVWKCVCVTNTLFSLKLVSSFIWNGGEVVSHTHSPSHSHQCTSTRMQFSNSKTRCILVQCHRVRLPAWAKWNETKQNHMLLNNACALCRTIKTKCNFKEFESQRWLDHSLFNAYVMPFRSFRKWALYFPWANKQF